VHRGDEKYSVRRQVMVRECSSCPPVVVTVSYEHVLIEPEAAKAYEEANRPAPAPAEPKPTNGSAPQPQPQPTTPTPGAAKPRSFHGTAEVPAATAKMRLAQFADEIVSILNSDPRAAVKLVVEISAEFPEGATDTVKRAVSENARSLGLKTADWE
jgi:uncharacterized protein